MFLSKIWFLIVTIAAFAIATVALVMPRPAERATALEEQSRLVVGCSVVGINLSAIARNRVQLVADFARDEKIVAALSDASAANDIDEDRMKKTRTLGDTTMKSIQGELKPAFAMLVDHRGRVVARVGADEDTWDDVVAGRPLVDDALAGYLRDDVWMVGKGSMFFVTASPVVKREGFQYVGAVVLGYKASTDLAKKLVVPGPQPINVAFFVGPDPIASSLSTALEGQELADAAKSLGGDPAHDCEASKQVEIKNGNDVYNVITARLPGEAGARGAYYAAFSHAPDAVGFSATLGKVTKSDLSPGSFPWILVGLGFVVVLGGGIALMIFEADRPLRRLVGDSVRLAKGEIERLSEESHGGKYGSIARSVNIAIDKLAREAKSAKKDMDQLLGPAPEGSLGTIDLLAGALPPSRPGGMAPSAPPPPSEFRFTEAPAPAAPPKRPPTPRPGTPPPIGNTPSSPGMPPMRKSPTPTSIPVSPAPAPPPAVAQAMMASPSAPTRLDDDILGSDGPAQDPYFKQVYDQFIAVKKSCNESTSGLTFEKFAEKLVKNRDDLMAKTGCREVRFTVYVKDGKAALKATPVKEA